MRIIGVMVFLAGMVMFASGLVFLDLASLPLKNDLYSIDVLGFFNNMFSLNPSLATMQTVLSGLFILMGCFICFGGAVMIRVKRIGGTIDPDLIPNYERVVSGKPFGNFIAFPTQMARATYNRAVKLGIVNGKVLRRKWKRK